MEKNDYGLMIKKGRNTNMEDLPLYLTFDDVLLLPQYSDFSLTEIMLETNLTENIQLKIPVVAAPMDKVCESALALVLGKLGGVGIIHRNQPIEQQVKQIKEVIKQDVITGAAIGVGVDFEDRLKALVNAGTRIICIDSGRGYSAEVIRAVGIIKKQYTVEVIAGNVATYEGALALFQAGADALRVGKGAGGLYL